jgi:small subunit ribosomal protein S4
MRLEEKQKLRFNYGLSEKQLINYIKDAKRIKGATGNVLLQLLEMRLDNLVFRLGMAPTIAAARQLVTHKHITINGSCVSIPSYQCQIGDILSVKENKKSKDLVAINLESSTLSNIPQHLDFDKKTFTAKVLGIVDREWVALKLNELFVIEFYSRKIS